MRESRCNEVGIVMEFLIAKLNFVVRKKIMGSGFSSMRGLGPACCHGTTAPNVQNWIQESISTNPG
jgi:hypothetical protein